MSALPLLWTVDFTLAHNNPTSQYIICDFNCSCLSIPEFSTARGRDLKSISDAERMPGQTMCDHIGREALKALDSMPRSWLRFRGSRSAWAQQGTRAAHVANAASAKTLEIASDKDVQAAAACAAGGAAVLGTGGAATGLATGGTIGAAMGLVPAIFTFGLSVPVFAAVGGGCGA